MSVAPKEVVHESDTKYVEIISSQEKEEPLSNQHDTIIVQHIGEVNVDYFDIVPSRGFPIRHQALQKNYKFPLGMLVSKYEGEISIEGGVCFAPIQGTQVLERFLSLSTGKVFSRCNSISCILDDMFSCLNT